MKNILLFFLSFLLLISLFSKQAFAIENPLSVANNKVGIHILFPSELSEAAKLVNANGGDWGYVTIPIQSGDKDLVKWQSFMDQAKKLHIIPIIRLATQGDYFNTQVWTKPTQDDIIDFANFLNSLNWPTTNRYIIVYNEVNRGDEWDSTPNPAEYAQLLEYAVKTFKARNANFFIISAGLDNAAANTPVAMNEFNFLSQMHDAVPSIFDDIDGLGSHSYPNPAFSKPPSITNSMSIASFQYETSLIHQYTNKTLPIFITETGWSSQVLSDSTIASYFQQAFTSVWNNNNIVAVTPFLLDANTQPFSYFSLITPDGSQNAIYKAIQNLTKTKGLPSQPLAILEAGSITVQNLPAKDFSKSKLPILPHPINITPFKPLLKWLLHM